MTIKITYVSSAGCSVCKITQPAFNHLSDYHPEWEYDFTDVSKVMDLLLTLGAEYLPIFLIYKNGTVIGHIEGSHRVKDLVDKIEGVINKWI